MPENNENLSKLQIRSFVLSVIESLKFQNNLNYPNFNEIIEQIKSLNNDNAVCEILIKELFTTNSQSSIAIVSTLLLNTINKDVLEEKLFDVLQNQKMSDAKKSMAMELLAGIGKVLNYDEYQNYFDDPSKVINEDTIKLLNSAMVHPEAKIDFLDFYSSLANGEKILLLDSLIEDHDSDLIVNLVQNIVFIEDDDEILFTILDILNKYKSPLALEPLEFLLKYSDNQKIQAQAKKILKEYNFAKINKDKAKKINKIIVEDTVLEPFWITYPDGEGNVGIIVSRIIKSNGQIQIMALVANDIYGITGCFGFSQITKEDFLKILTKFSAKDEQVKIERDYLLPIINYFKNINFQTKNILPYEFLCFSPLCQNDNEKFDENANIFSIIVNEFEDDIQNLNNNDLDLILNLSFIKKWFFTERQIETIKEVFDKIYETQNIEICMEYYEQIFDGKFTDIIKKRLKLSSLLYKVKNETIASKLYNLSLSENADLFDNFLKILYKKSIYQYFLQMENNLTDSKKTLNIFFLKNRKNDSSQKLDFDKVENIINEIEAKWKQI